MSLPVPHRPTIAISILNHLRQRKTMAALQERHRVQFAARTEGRKAEVCRITIDGQEYDAMTHEIILLDAGRSPADLGLKPVPD